MFCIPLQKEVLETNCIRQTERHAAAMHACRHSKKDYVVVTKICYFNCINECVEIFL